MAQQVYETEDFKKGYTDGEAAAFLDLPGYPPASATSDYAQGFENGYDESWERADKIREAFGCEESYSYGAK